MTIQARRRTFSFAVLGKDTRSVLREAGLSLAAIEATIARGAVFAAD